MPTTRVELAEHGTVLAACLGTAGYGEVSDCGASRYTLITVSGARTSLSGWLARMGFTDIPKAERELAALGITSEDHSLLASSAQAADPDLALAGLAQVAERDPRLI